MSHHEDRLKIGWSWKEIADINREVTTIQRMEKREEIPVSPTPA